MPQEWTVSIEGRAQNRLKNLYEYLIGNRKHEAEVWHDAYREFCDNDVGEIREKIKDGEKLSHESDHDFLKELLFERDNGISVGQSSLGEASFQSLIENEDFMSALENFMRDPRKETYTKFDKAWRDQNKVHNRARINRVAAVCTREVSTVVDPGKFKEVFSWLIDEGIIPEYSGTDEDWFSKNVFLLEHIHEAFEDELEKGDTDEVYLSQFVWGLYENLSNPFSLKKQIVKYGAPGTGKTYQARQQTSLLFDIWKEEFAPDSDLTDTSQIEFVQFHPSFSYEDFMEGLRPDLDDHGNAHLTLQNGVFKEFCKKAGKWEIDVCNLDRDLDWESIKIENLHPYREKLPGDYWQYIFEVSDPSKPVSDAVPPFFFIIDEVNRAELSRVFGELMYCLEYRGVKGRVKTQYANLNNEHTGMWQDDQGYRFFIPTNIYLIGTMNTIDRSVESFDFALRRRFFWEEVTPDTGLLRYHLKHSREKWVALAGNLERLNDEIDGEPLLGHDYKIGHAYLMDLKYDESLTVAEVRKRVWHDRIRPLLQEYLRGTGKKKNDLIGSFKTAFFKD